MPDLPSGTVTFLFTDIEGSTRLLQRLGQDYGGVLGEHRRLLRRTWSAYSGDEIDAHGDAFLVVFRRAQDAAQAAVAAQRALADESWPEGSDLRVRMGIHTAEPSLSNEGYLGLGVHRAARICAAAHGGQILASQATEALLADEQLDGLEMRDLGRHLLKDFDRPARLFQLVAPGLVPSFPPPRTVESQPNEAVPFAVGEQELAAAAESVGSARAVPRSRAIAAAVAVIAAGALALGLALALRGGEKAALVVPKDAVGLIDPQSNKVIDVIPVGEDPVSVAAGRGAVWVANLNSSTVSRIDPRNHRVTERGIPFHPAALAASRDAVWAGSLTGPEVARIDANGVLPIALRAATANSAENGAGAVAVSSDGVWALVGNFLLEKIDPTTNRVVLSVETTNGPVDVAVGEGAVWTAGAGSVGQHDPKTGTMLQEAPAGGTYLAGIIAVGEGAIWTASGAGGGGTVWKIDPATMQVEDRITVGGNPTSIAVGRGAVWVGDGSSGQVERLDPRSDSVSARIRLGRAPVSSLAVSPQGVWAAVGPRYSRFRGPIDTPIACCGSSAQRF